MKDTSREADGRLFGEAVQNFFVFQFFVLILWL